MQSKKISNDQESDMQSKKISNDQEVDYLKK